MTGIATAPNLPGLPPISGHFIPGHQLNIQAGAVLAELLREAGSALSSITTTGKQVDAKRIVSLDDKQLAEFRSICQTQLESLSSSDPRAKTLQRLIENADSIISYRETLQGERKSKADSGQPSQEQIKHRSELHPSESTAELYRKALENTPETLKSLLHTQVAAFNRSGAEWTENFKEKQYSRLVATISALETKEPTSGVADLTKNLANPWREEAIKRISEFAPTIAQVDRPGVLPPAPKSEGSPSSPDTSKSTAGKTSGGAIQAPEAKPPLPPLPPYIFPQGTAPAPPLESFPSQAWDLQLPPGLPAHEQSPSAGVYGGTTVRQPNKDDSVLHKDSVGGGETMNKESPATEPAKSPNGGTIIHSEGLGTCLASFGVGGMTEKATVPLDRAWQIYNGKPADWHNRWNTELARSEQNKKVGDPERQTAGKANEEHAVNVLGGIPSSPLGNNTGFLEKMGVDLIVPIHREAQGGDVVGLMPVQVKSNVRDAIHFLEKELEQANRRGLDGETVRSSRIPVLVGAISEGEQAIAIKSLRDNGYYISKSETAKGKVTPEDLSAIESLGSAIRKKTVWASGYDLFPEFTQFFLKHQDVMTKGDAARGIGPEIDLDNSPKYKNSWGTITNQLEKHSDVWMTGVKQNVADSPIAPVVPIQRKKLGLKPKS